MARRPIRRRRVLIVALAVLAGVALGASTFLRLQIVDGRPRFIPRFDLSRWLAELPSHLSWVIPFMFLTTLLPLTRALLWRLTLPPPRPPPGPVAHALLLGGLVHNAVPGHLGPFASAGVLCRHLGLPFATALASFLLAKLAEFGVLLAFVALLSLAAQASGERPEGWSHLLLAGSVAGAAFAAVAAGTYRFARPLSIRFTRQGRFPRAAGWLASLADGVHAIGSGRRLMLIATAAMLPVLAGAAAYGLALRHVGVTAYLVGGGLLLGALALSQVTPGLPAGPGLYYFVCATVARALGVSAENAASLAVLSHAATAGTAITLGLLSLLIPRLVGGRPPWLRRASPPDGSATSQSSGR